MKWAVGIGALLLIVAVLPSVVGGRSRSSFAGPNTVEMVRQALASNNLQVCAEQPLNWTATPGFVRGEYVQVSRDCFVAQPGARLWIAQFDSADARDTALVNAEAVYRRPIGTTITWSDGPVAIVVDGDQDPETITSLRAALAASRTGA
jgi:hypothetical protein